MNELLPGKDNHVKAVKVRTPLGKNCTTLLRPVQHLYPLESANIDTVEQEGPKIGTTSSKLLVTTRKSNPLV